MDKQTYEKHEKYLKFYSSKTQYDEEYWGLGIENESYIMFETLEKVDKLFIQRNQMPERYSVDYWKNYRYVKLQDTLNKLPSTLRVPTYVSSYLFRNVDLLGEHKTIFGSRGKENPIYSDETIDTFLKRVSPAFTKFFEKHLIYDGDTFEFTTCNFYKTDVVSVIKELAIIKSEILAELNKRLISKFTIFKKPLVFPRLNYGFAKFQSNLKNIAICNNGTYHINLTLPTALDADGQIKNQDEFKANHANAIRAIQWIEPLLIGLYGTPDILSQLDTSYAAGSQRLAFSRYIGLGTFDTSVMEKGKLLDTFSYKDKKNYYEELHSHKDSPYFPARTIGYDINYNKFKNHGIELRILDYFPEEYLEAVLNFLILVCQCSLHIVIPDPRLNATWTSVCAKAIKQGSQLKLPHSFYTEVYKVFGLNQDTWLLYRWPFFAKAPMLHVANRLASKLYKKYSKDSVCSKMSPDMKAVVLVDYNSQVKREFAKLLCGF